MSETTSSAELEELSNYARQAISEGSKSFAGASRLFRSDMRASAQLLYAWCRHCDDVIDGQVAGFKDEDATQEEIAERLSLLRTQTQRAIDGKADSPAFAALAYVVKRHEIPARFPFELLDGFEMDAIGHHYKSIDDTILYSYYVAGVVGVMMAMIMGVRDDEVLDRACDLGIGFQLTNISRDVMDDWNIGRVYLPQDWLDEMGVPRDNIGAPKSRVPVFRVVDRLLDTAESYYDSAYFGIGELPFRAACAISTARRVYREIGRQVRHRQHTAWDSRTVVSKPKKYAGACLAVMDSTYAHTFGRLSRPPARTGLWTRAR